MDAARVIRLRRPPVLVMHEGGPFVPEVSSSMIDEVDARWQRICEAKPETFDGRICHVLGVHRNGHGGATIHVMDCAYRFHAVQDQRFDLGVRGLGAKAITMRKGLVLMGKRAREVGSYPGLWEFAPGGVVEPGEDPAQAIERELLQETGLLPAGQPTAAAAIYDPTARTWEIVHSLSLTGSDRLRRGPEYEDLAWVSLEEAPRLGDLTPPAHIMVPIAEEMRTRTAQGRQPGEAR